MRRFLKKMVMGNTKPGKIKPTGAIEKRVHNIKAIWNNDHNDDVGIEKLFRLFLASSQFLFPGIYVNIFSGNAVLKFKI